MIRGSKIVAVALGAGLLAACQTEPGAMGGGMARPAATVMDGNWAATDGVFLASFTGGAFTSRFTKTNEILAQGNYRVMGKQVTMEWLSVATQQQRSADCTIVSPSSVRCAQSGGGGFDLRRA